MATLFFGAVECVVWGQLALPVQLGYENRAVDHGVKGLLDQFSAVAQAGF